ncbi:M28 family peptidase [Sphingomonas sp.]|uniref:M28 family peptidase n=1 Tax=Sphingomonas sp. TaxID=28214 RepID=UPI00286D6CAD|nr:M28 family peptidase [Sphingomonas sp.]
MKLAMLSAATLFMASPALAAPDDPPLLQAADAAALAQEISGSAAKRTVQSLSLHHRMRGSRGYRAAAEIIRDKLKSYGLAEVEIIALPADGSIYYGTQRSRPAWNASFAELWDQRRDVAGGDGARWVDAKLSEQRRAAAGGAGARWVDAERVASWAHEPISLAQDSVSGRAEAELVDVGAGTADSDYAGKDVRGKLVLTSSQPEAMAGLAVTKYGAAGIISWAQNQQTAWWGEDESLVRWGHLDTFKDPAFAFMVSPRQARGWAARLAKGESVHLRAAVEAGRSAGHYLIPTAVIPGRDRRQEIVYSCHLDHPSPGANDNASGCAGILEAARGLNRLIAERRLPQPERTIRFIWPCEIECTIALLNARPEFAKRTLATIHLDMIGGDSAKTKSILRVEGSPPSLPSFVGDVGFSIARWVNAQSLAFADTGTAAWPLTDPAGDKTPLQAEIGGFSQGSDHQVWAEGSWRIPVIYVSDWPDRYIHTQRDIPENLDATKLKRAVFIAAASGWYLANLGQRDAFALQAAMQAEIHDRRGATARRIAVMPAADAALIARHGAMAELAALQSLARFGLRPVAEHPAPAPLVSATAGPGALVYRRKPTPKGPMDGFGFSWLDDRLERSGLTRPALLAREAGRGVPSFGYEALNLVDGERPVDEIRAHLLATVGAVPVEEVAEYLATLARLGLLEAR